MDTAVALKLHDDLLATQPEGARHDTDICPFCVEKASRTTASDPSGPGRPGVSKSDLNKSTEGGTTPPMSDISQEAHEALLNKAVSEATKVTEAALATKAEEAASANSEVAKLKEELATVNAETERLNKELDAAQVKLTSATEEVATLKSEAAKAEEAARLTEVASKRGEQVKNLKLFPDEYVGEKASKWAAFTDEAWGEQLEEWKQLKPASAGEGQSDAASAMTGTSERLTKEQQDAAAAAGGTGDKPTARRSVLGLA